MVDGKNVGSKLTKSDFVCRHDCAACRMTKMTAPWVRQKAAGLTADGSAAQILLERVIICEDCYVCHLDWCARLGVPRLRRWWRVAAANKRAWEDETWATAGIDNDSGRICVGSERAGCSCSAGTTTGGLPSKQEGAGWTSRRGI